jgi:hypothetical protein
MNINLKYIFLLSKLRTTLHSPSEGFIIIFIIKIIRGTAPPAKQGGAKGEG